MKKACEVAFLKVVELGSIRAAARALDQDPSGISRRVAQLEQRLGAKLVERRGNATIATAQGQLYYERLSSIIGQLEALEAEVSGEDLVPSGLLRVTSAIDFGQEFVADWLLDYRRKFADVEFDLVLASGFVDMTQNGIDVALRVGELPDSRLIAKKLADVPRVLVASPGYLKRKGTPWHPGDLQDHEFVFFSPTNRQQPLRLLGPDNVPVRVQRSGGIAINAVRSAVNAVVAGHGIHCGPLWAFAPHIARGDIVQVLPDYTQRQLPLYAVRQPSNVVPARISSFINHVAERVKSVEGLITSDAPA
ncbi:LysR family transcriptional regulator [Cognatiyoonia sp. IB215182]|uniref:LysR family transcriptional regulator n=1 Tax=Cognatiyoonia sp. IB215182 TaxID=3097353 RepID=UPI002A116F87|nr:LysR family transcriptional regulator [Cognatiyoonia sp. IB215182]MDX8354729.1 LysR family transcriptional regulator [Cognatiyoonia sp. IB215182]